MTGGLQLQRTMQSWLASHHGVIAGAQLRSFGASKGAIAHLLRSEILVPMLPGVYRSPTHPRSDLQTMVAVCLRYPDAAVAATTAGRLLGIRGMSDPAIHVLFPHHQTPQVPDITVHRSRRLDRSDIVDNRPDGIRLTRPARTLLDAADLVGREALESAIEHALRDGMCALRTLLRTADRLHHPRRPGSMLFREVVTSRPAWRNAARSDLEVRFLRALLARGLPEPLVNERLTLDGGSPIEVDLLWPAQLVIAEIDHPYWHDGSGPRRRDRLRDRRTSAHGWLTVRFDEHDVGPGLDAATDDLARVLAARGWTPALTA